VEIANNNLQGDVLGKNITLVATPRQEIKLDKKQHLVFAE
jgi:hypothetical protein